MKDSRIPSSEMTPSRLYLRRRKKMLLEAASVMIAVVNVVVVLYSMLLRMWMICQRQQQSERRRSIRKHRHTLANLNKLIRDSDVACRNLLRLDRRTFDVLCEMVRDIGGLSNTGNMSLESSVALFLYLLSHPNESRLGGNYVLRRAGNGSKLFHRCLLGFLSLYWRLLKKPSPITEDCEDDRWKCFKNCLGALDTTFIDVHVPNEDKGRYRTKKGTISINVLGAFTPNMEFAYVLTGWEGSAGNDRVLQSAISRPNGLNVPQGCYYLLGTEYPNFEGFLTPYQGHPYNLKARQDREPMNAAEYFNMKHYEARNAIRKCFALMKERWAILRSMPRLSIQMQGRIVLVCALLHNLIREFMPEDDIEVEAEEDEEEEEEESEDEDIDNAWLPDNWAIFRDTLAQNMFHS